MAHAQGSLTGRSSGVCEAGMGVESRVVEGRDDACVVVHAR